MVEIGTRFTEPAYPDIIWCVNAEYDSYKVQAEIIDGPEHMLGQEELFDRGFVFNNRVLETS